MSLPSALNDVFTGIFASIAKEQAEAFSQVAELPAVQAAREHVRDLDTGGFYYKFMHPIDNLVDGLLAAELPGSSDARFIFKNSQFVECHFRALIEQYDGNSCCADKTRTVVKALLTYLTTGKDIAFDHTQKYTFHLPKKVFTTHQEVLQYFKAVQRLFYGQSDAYMTVLLAISLRLAPVQESEVSQAPLEG